MSSATALPPAIQQAAPLIAVAAGELPATSELSRFRAAMRDGSVPDLSTTAPTVSPGPPPAAPTPQQTDEESFSTTTPGISKRQQYINDLIRAQTRAELERDQLRAQLEYLSRPPTTAVEPATTDAEAYARATTDAEAYARATTDYEHAQLTAYLTTVETAKTQFPDFDEVTTRPLPAPLSGVMRDAIRASAIGGTIAYHLTLHPDEYLAIRAMPVGRALMAMGALEAKLTTSTAAPSASAPQPAPPVTTLPAPMAPVGGNPTAGSPDVSAMTSLDEFRRVIKPKFGMRG